MPSSPGEVTQLLARINAGDKAAKDRLFTVVYPELRRFAGGYLRRERYDHTLQATALVHETYMKLTGMEDVGWQSRSHFFATAANAMRRILVDYARARRAGKREGFREAMSLDETLVVSPARSAEWIAVHEALEQLAKIDARRSQVVEFRYFGGMSEEEIALALGVSVRTVKRDWRTAKAWLYNELSCA